MQNIVIVEVAEQNWIGAWKMRLIDADYFKIQIAAATIKFDIEPKKTLAIMELIDTIPTAYNIDEVSRTYGLQGCDKESKDEAI